MFTNKYTLLILVITGTISGQTPAESLAQLPQMPYGFVFADMGITDQDSADFNQLDIREINEYNQFGQFNELEDNVYHFLHSVGQSEDNIIKKVTRTITAITNQIVALSQQETAWISIRASCPIDTYDVSRWHMDSYYFTPTQQTEIMYKFAITLVGAPTLFYPIAKDERRAVWRKTLDRQYMHDFCKQDQIVTPGLGQGTFFLSGRIEQAALHSEPPIHEKRLFFSIVPCNKKQAEELRRKIRPFIEKQK